MPDEFDMERARALTNEYIDVLLDTTAEFAEETHEGRIAVGVILAGLAAMAAGTIASLKEDARPEALVAFIGDLITLADRDEED